MFNLYFITTKIIFYHEVLSVTTKVERNQCTADHVGRMDFAKDNVILKEVAPPLMSPTLKVVYGIKQAPATSVRNVTYAVRL